MIEMEHRGVIVTRHRDKRIFHPAPDVYARVEADTPDAVIVQMIDLAKEAFSAGSREGRAQLQQTLRELLNVPRDPEGSSF